MTDLERFFRRIVANLAATDPGRLHHPLPLTDIPFAIVPYRTNRRALQLDSSEEYELVLLRLCAGEGGYLRTEPEEVRQRFETEATSANPDLEIIHRFEDVIVTLRPERVDAALRIPSTPNVAPTAPAPVEMPMEEEAAEDPGGPLESSDPPQCLFCGGALPDRPVNFCPHCGQSQSIPICPQCHTDVEPEWRHCANCGAGLASR